MVRLLFNPILLTPGNYIYNSFNLFNIINLRQTIQKRNTPMFKKLMTTLLTLMLILSAETAAAESMDFELQAGSSSVAGSVDYRRPLYDGYMKMGISGLHSDSDSTEYHWGALQLLVGSDTLAPGFWAEVGFKGIFGSVEEDAYSGDIAVLGFSGNVGYTFPSYRIPIPVELFGGVTYAPDPLAFMDTSMFTEITFGIDMRLIQQASIELSYHIYNIDLDEGPGRWNFDDNALRFGIVMRF
jgi:hypothetical protein